MRSSGMRDDSLMYNYNNAQPVMKNINQVKLKLAVQTIPSEVAPW